MGVGSRECSDYILGWLYHCHTSVHVGTLSSPCVKGRRDQETYKRMASESHSVIHTKMHTHKAPNEGVLCQKAGHIR